MLAVVVRFALGAVLLAAAATKLASPRSSAAALSTFGFADRPLRWAAWGSLIVAEVVLGVGVAAGSDSAAYLAATLATLFALLLIGAMMRGKTGAPCACFGPRSRVGPAAVGRNLVLAAALAALPQLPSP